MDALLFKVSEADGTPEFRTCADEWVDFHADRTRPGWDGWIMLITERAIEEQRTADIEAVRESDEKKWTPLIRPRRRCRSRRRVKKRGTTGE